MRLPSVTVVFVLSCFLFLTAGAGTPRYAVTQLRQFSAAASNYSSGISIGDDGTIVGQAYLTSYPKPLKWTPENELIELPLPAGMAWGMALNITGSGYIAGHAATIAAPWQDYPVMYGPNGTVQLRPNGLSQLAIVCDVAETGEVLINQSGWVSLLSATSTTRLDTTGITVNARTKAVLNGATEAVVTGSTRVNSVDRVRPYRIGIGIPPQLLVTEERDSAVSDIDNKGIAVGRARSATVANSAYFAAVFRDGQIILPTLAGSNSSSLVAINDASRFVGYGNTPFDSFPVVGEGNELRNLNTLIPADSGWTLYSAEDINNRGQIIGQGGFDHDNNPNTPRLRSGFRLDPIRLPGDTNYDDVVDFADVLTLAQHYGQSGNGNVFYETGDFNYDWSVDFDDLLTLAQHYSAPASFENDWKLARSIVPEPGLLCIASACYAGRRRSR